MRTKLLFFLFCALSCLGSMTSLSAAATYYVRPDGGTCDQCTGQVDAAYPGSGTDQPCAWAHPFWALDTGGNWRIQGGDTLVIYTGSYMMGYGAPNTAWCFPEGAFDCHLPPLPSGPTPENPTRIVGVGWDSGCPDPPELWGTQRSWHILDLTGTSNAFIACLELTDHSGCVESHANPQIRCERDAYPFGDWAGAGIYASDSSNVTLKHLNIHGFADRGVYGGRISDWTVEDVRIAGNGWAGWDGDIYGDDSNSGTLRFSNWLVEWNGCAESYPDEEPNNCWAQTAGGYGDGVGTGETGGHWIIEDSTFRYNTSDGLDLLYARRLDSQIEIRRSSSYGNAGDQMKVNGPTAIENSLMVSNCGCFAGKPFTYHVDNCRGGGSALSLNLRQGDSISVVNATIAGQGDCLGIVECDGLNCDGSETITIQNSIFKGYQDYLQPWDRTCYLWFDQDDFYTTHIDYNVIFSAKIGSLGLAPHDMDEDPLFANSSLESFDGHLQAESPAIDSGLSVGGLVPNHDMERLGRPQGSGVDRGAYEFSAVPPFAKFSAWPTRGRSPLTVRFRDQSTGHPTSWLWHFGDGQTSTLQNPSHTYATIGSYSVTLDVHNPFGSHSGGLSDYVSVMDHVSLPWLIVLVW